MKVSQVKDDWAGGDPDDVAGYLLDYLNSEMTDEVGEPLDDSTLQQNLEGCNDWVVNVMVNLRNATRAKNEDFDE